MCESKESVQRGKATLLKYIFAGHMSMQLSLSSVVGITEPSYGFPLDVVSYRAFSSFSLQPPSVSRSICNYHNYTQVRQATI